MNNLLRITRPKVPIIKVGDKIYCPCTGSQYYIIVSFKKDGYFELDRYQNNTIYRDTSEPIGHYQLEPGGRQFSETGMFSADNMLRENGKPLL